MKRIKQNLVVLLITASFISTTLFIPSCGTDDDLENNEQHLKLKNEIDPELFNYFQSEDFKHVQKNFKIGSNNLNFKNIIKNNYDDISVVLYYFSVNNDKGIKIGNFCIASNKKGSKYFSLFEDMSDIIGKNKGEINVYTGDGLFVAKISAIKKSNTFSLQLDDVANSESTQVRLKSGGEIEWPSPNESWYSCTTKCYAAAKAACDGDPDCQFLKDMSDIAGGLGTISIAAACSIYCVYH